MDVFLITNWNSIKKILKNLKLFYPNYFIFLNLLKYLCLKKKV